MTTADVLAWLAEASVVLTLIVAPIFLVRWAARRRLAAGWIYALWLAAPAALIVSLAPSGLIVLPAGPPAPWLLTIWLAGAVGFLTAHAAAQIRFERRVVASARKPNAAELAALKRAADGAALDPARDFRFTSAVDGPIASGLLRPVVLMPERFLDGYSADERRVMVLHEAEHVRAGHIGHRLVARLIRDLFWFHPIAWAAERAFIADQELACDRAALRRDSGIRPRIYAATLLKAAQAAAGRASLSPAATVPLIAMQDLKARAAMLDRHLAVGRTDAAGVLLLGGLAAAAVLAGLALRNGAEPASRLAEAASEEAAAPVVAARTPPLEPAQPASVPEEAPQAAEPPPTILVIRVEPAGPRIFSPQVGEIVVAAQDKMSASPPDLEGAREDLSRALGMNPTAYELGVILYMRGGVKYQLGDIDGALSDWTRALAEGDLAPTERLSLVYNIGQLHLSEGRYREAADILEQWIEMGGQPNDGVHLNLVAAYVELGELQKALEHARKAFDLANPPQKKHYDSLAYLYELLGMTAEREALLGSMPPELR